MSQAEAVDDDLLPEDLMPGAKKAAVPLKRSAKQVAALERKAEADALQQEQVRLAQIVNLHIGGYSLADIGRSIGATEEEVDRLLSEQTARYVRSQPALRNYVRGWVSGKYTALLETVWDRASDPDSAVNLDAVDRATRILDRMAKLHGADAPVQHDLKIETAPEAVEKLVASIAAHKGLGYDIDVFDIEVVEDPVSGNADSQEDAPDGSQEAG